MKKAIDWLESSKYWERMKRKKCKKIIWCVVLAFSGMPCVFAGGQCNYGTYTWNTLTRSAVDYQRIEKPYIELGEHEIDAATGCSVCEQDQVEIQLNGLEPFKICRVFADQVQETLNDLMASGQPLEKIVGYRVGMTRGDVDGQGNRTRFSNHSFGIAIDINPEQNGLYDRCIEYSAQCRLIKGGPWLPDTDKRSLTADSPVVKALAEIGLRWGGQIDGKQKDFMHFSPTGY
jgi:hypothetical protein